MSTPVHRWALRRLLQLDRPVPPATEEQANAAAERNYRWNFTVNLLDGAAFWFGLSFASASTIGPLFISKLTDSPVAVGLLAVVAQGGWFLPQLFTANALGLTTFIGTGMGTVGAGLSAWLLATFPFPLNFAYTFLIAAVGITVSWAFLALTREPVQTAHGERQNTRQFWEKLRTILSRDHNFRRFMVARIMLALAAMGQGFITVAAVRRWDVQDSVVGGFTAALLLGQTTGNLIFGMLADRFGHKLSLELSGLAAMLSFALAWLAPSPVWYNVVFFLLGLYLGAIVVSGILVVLEFSAPERRPTYVGLANTSVGVAGALAPLGAAAIAGLSYSLLFALSAMFSLLGLILMRWWVREPRYL